MRSLGIRALGLGATAVAVAAALAGGCGGGSSGSGTTTTMAGSGGGGGATTSTLSGPSTSTGSGGHTTSSSNTTSSTGTGTGGNTPLCTTTAKGELRGSAIALTADDKTVVAVNRDAGTVSILSVDYTGGEPSLTLVAELPVGAEPWQVVIDGCNTTAYVVLRKDQKVVEITGIGTAAPALGKSFPVGSEPTSLALTPNNTQLYVANWVDGTLSVIDPTGGKATSTVDLNPVIAATGFLGPEVMASPRASLAHPRAIAITNSGDAVDTDETVYVTEFFAVRTKPEDPANLAGSDVNWKGLLYQVPVLTGAATTVDLPPIANTGFKDAKGNETGCFPNQVASVTIDGGFAYVTSTCASPVGPTGVFQKGACALASQCPAGPNTPTCSAGGACNNTCTQDSDCGFGSALGACNLTGNPGGGVCAPLTANAKTTTHPGLTIVKLADGTATTTNLDAPFTNTVTPTSTAVTTLTPPAPSARLPLLPTDMAFRPGFGYVASEGADALFRLTITGGAITAVGSATNDFIDMRTAASATIRLPIGVAVSQNQAFAFVNNDGDRDVTAVDLSTQSIATSTTPVVQAPSLAKLSTAEASQLNGKRFFNTGLARWSLAGAAWGSCGACHVDGLSDNVTWYFARGPRQTTSLDGTFNKADLTDQRILNWSAINDEVADFEGNVRGISGGVGAIVSATSTPPVAADRINTFNETPSQQGLQGSSADAANPAGASAHPHSVIGNWADITHWIQTLRSPRAPTNLVQADVTAGAALFTGAGQGNCVGCHSGGKWTISKVFYTPGDVPNDAFTAGTAAATSLSGTPWDANLNGFPAPLFPSVTAGKQTMRSGAPPTFEQIQCILRPVGTIKANGAVPTGVSPTAVNVLELRQDMVTGAQGAGGINANDFTTGFNVPSLLGMQVGAPYFHAGNARSLEEALSTTFVGHYQSAVAQVFDLNPSTNTMAPTLVKQLVAYLLSIDGSTAPVAVPTLGSHGGDLCHTN